MSIATVIAINNNNKEEKMHTASYDSLQDNLHKIFENAKKIISVQDFVKVVKAVAFAIKDVLQLAVYAGISITALAFEYINLFVAWIKEHLGVAKAKLAKQQVVDVVK